jgi:hypothetical protein
VYESDIEQGSRPRRDPGHAKAGAADAGFRKHCAYCGKDGHTDRQCFKKRRDSRQPRPTREPRAMHSRLLSSDISNQQG